LNPKKLESITRETRLCNGSNIAADIPYRNRGNRLVLRFLRPAGGEHGHLLADKASGNGPVEESVDRAVFVHEGCGVAAKERSRRPQSIRYAACGYSSFA
jgi:hypothetical protein